MKRILALSMVFVIVMASSAFAVEEKHDYELRTVEAVSESVNTLSTDGVLSELNKNYILNHTDPKVVQEYVATKIDESFELAKKLSGTVELDKVKNGKAYGRQVIKLINGCTLTIEFEEGEDCDTEVLKRVIPHMIMPMASNGETMWKNYGNRYFTAKATVNVGLGAGSVMLENHYILSDQGIDENYGVASVFEPNTTCSITEKGIVITDRSARSVGSSDVNMHANFKVVYKAGGATTTEQNVKLSTSVGYVDHNTTAKQIKVKHSWSLS